MVLQGAQSRRGGQDECNLLSAQSFPYDLARLYGHAGAFTSADLGGIADPCIEEVQIWSNSHGQKSFSALRSRRRKVRLQRNQLPDVEGTFYVPGHCSDHLDAVRPDRFDMGFMR